MIASAGPGGPVRAGQQRFDLVFGEEPDDGGVGAFRGDRQDPADGRGVVGAAQRRVGEQGVDRGEAVVAGRGAVAAPGFEVVEERPDQRGVNVGEVESRGRRAELLLGEAL